MKHYEPSNCFDLRDADSLCSSSRHLSGTQSKVTPCHALCRRSNWKQPPTSHFPTQHTESHTSESFPMKPKGHETTEIKSGQC